MSVTAEQVKAYREKHGVGLLDAKRALDRQDRQQRLLDIEGRLNGGWGIASCSTVLALVQILKEMNQ